MFFLKEETQNHIIYKFLFIKFKFKKNRTKIRNNNIYVIDKNGKKKKFFFVFGLKVHFEGENSSVILHSPICKFKNSKISIGSNSSVEIKSSSQMVRKLNIEATADNVSCFIDEELSCFNGLTILLHKENNLKVTMGKNCMVGSNVSIRTTDAHTIADKNTKQILNYGKDVIIGNHVWLARDVSVMKGVKIADNSVVGAYSVVTKSLEEENALYVGIPAKKIKSEIEWYRNSIPQYLEAIEKGNEPF